ncbi:MAG TPA: hypothetical protein VF763_00095 [Candidatus Limnocylindrales bacterium]
MGTRLRSEIDPSSLADERILWRGSPEPGRVLRRYAVARAAFVLALAAGFVPIMVYGGLDRFLGFTVAVLVAMVLLGAVLPIAWRLATSRGRPPATVYTVTTRRLLIDGRGACRDVRLADLAALELRLEGGGYGSIVAASSVRGRGELLRRLERWAPSLVGGHVLLESIPEARAVLELMRQARAGLPEQGAELVTASA